MIETPVPDDVVLPVDRQILLAPSLAWRCRPAEHAHAARRAACPYGHVARHTWRSLAILSLTLTVAVGCGPRDLIRVSETTAGAYEASLAAFDDGLVAAWYDTRDGHPEIYIRQLDRNARPNGPGHRLTTTRGAAYEVDARPLGRDLAVAWYEKAPDGHLTPRLGAWTRDGAPLWSIVLASEGRNPIVRVAGDVLFAAWIAKEDGTRAGLWSGWWSREGVALGTPRRLADVSDTTWNLNGAATVTAAGARRAIVVFDAVVGTASNEIFVVDVHEESGGEGEGPSIASAPQVVRLTDDDGVLSKYPDVAISGERAALTWFDERDGNEEIYLAIGPEDMLFAPGRLRPMRVTTTPGHSIGAYLAWNQDVLGLAWCDDSDDGQHDVFFRRFDASGGAVGAVRRITRTPADSLIPAIVPWRSGFALAWNEYERASGDGHGGGRSQVAVSVVP